MRRAVRWGACLGSALALAAAVHAKEVGGPTKELVLSADEETVFASPVRCQRLVVRDQAVVRAKGERPDEFWTTRGVTSDRNSACGKTELPNTVKVACDEVVFEPGAELRLFGAMIRGPLNVVGMRSRPGLPGLNEVDDSRRDGQAGEQNVCVTVHAENFDGTTLIRVSSQGGNGGMGGWGSDGVGGGQGGRIEVLIQEDQDGKGTRPASGSKLNSREGLAGPGGAGGRGDPPGLEGEPGWNGFFGESGPVVENIFGYGLVTPPPHWEAVNP